MTATGFLFMLIGVFVLFNATNIVGAIEGNVKLTASGSNTTSTTRTPSGVPSGVKGTGR